MFVHLNCHSNYSLLAGANRIDELVQTAAAMGCPALALTDTNGLYGAIAFYQAAHSAGIRPILGTQVSGLTTAASATLLAKNLNGFGEICRIITDCHLQHDFSLAGQLAACSHDVVILCPDPAILQQVIAQRGPRDAYLELVGSARRGRRPLIQTEFPCVATNRVFFLRPKDEPIHRLLSAIRTNTTLHTLPPGACASPEAWLKPPREMARLFRDVPEAILNTRRIAEQCELELPIGEVRFPFFPLPPGETYDSHLAKLARAGLGSLYPRIPPEVVRRLRYELKVIEDLEFAPYFLIVWDIVREARARGILSVGRGSAANSLVCQALGITEVDPIRHNLYFERFLNPERTDYPDIDIDFPWNRRDEILDYVFDTYGRDHVALISTHIHFRGRSVVRETGKALGIPIPEIDTFTRRLPFFAEMPRLEEIRQTIPECRDLPLEDEPYRSLITLCRRIDGFPRHLSIHCGGIVISPFPITDRIPLQKTPKGFVVTQYDMYPVEDMGLLKIDLLAQKGLAVLADTVEAVERHYGTRIDFGAIDPTRDPKTRDLVRDGRTIGCFYIESPGMRNLLLKLGVESFEMLTAASSIIRPGVADSGMMKAFVDRHNGREPVTCLHPKMEALLKDTFGVMIYQEDVIKVAHTLAGMSLGEADSLRKCMSKKRNWEDINTHRQRFLSGAQANGVVPETALEIWRQIESFAGYAFCKAHSASFAVVSYQTAWLKAHYPAEFMAAVLSNRGGFYDACAYTEEARRMGLIILPPHVNHSEEAFTAQRSSPQKSCADSIRVGLSQVKGLTHRSLQAILEQRRQRGYYTSLADFLSRIDTGKPESEALIRCGALDGFGLSRPELLWQLACHTRRNPGLTLTPGQKIIAQTNPPFDPPGLCEYNLHEKLLAEIEHLDLTVSGHVLSLYDVDLRERIPARKISKFVGRIVTLAGWLVNSKRTRTVHNEFMKFMMLEDATAPFEVTLFPKVYRRFGPLLYDRGPYIVKGRVERDGRCCTITALHVARAGNLNRELC